MRHIFIIGSKGIPAKYGGFETFVDNLTVRKVSSDIKYHVSCMGVASKGSEYNGAHCFYIKVPNCGAAKAVYYDLFSLKYCIDYITKNKIKNALIYILACRIGPFIGHFQKRLLNLQIKLIVNPDGNEWKREKWNYYIRKYWLLSERYMVKYADALVCDSINIESYIKRTYQSYQPVTFYIPYGAELYQSRLTDNSPDLLTWYCQHKITPNKYYLMVGRFVPENNIELIIQEFMLSTTSKDLVIISNYENNSFYKKLQKQLFFETDSRIKFVGTVYNTELLKKIRENAYGYIHGHEVGGTNPSLLEAMASTDINLLLDVGFNREVGNDSVLYWSKENCSLSKLIDFSDKMTQSERLQWGGRAKSRIQTHFSWESIIRKYEELWFNLFDNLRSK